MDLGFWLLIAAVGFTIVVLRQVMAKGEPPPPLRSSAFAQRTQAAAAQAARLAELRSRAGAVVLRDNDWASCTIDGLSADWSVRVGHGTAAAPTTPTGPTKNSGEGPRGFCAVYPGRHQIITEVRGRPVVLDFVLYPGEVMVRRLSAGGRLGGTIGTLGSGFGASLGAALGDRAEWLREDGDTERQLREQATRGILTGDGELHSVLVDYLRAVQASAALPDPDTVLPRVLAQFDGLLERLKLGAPVEALLRDAYALGLSLLRVPLDEDDWTRLVGTLDASAAAIAMQGAVAGDYRQALAAILMALAVLPGEAQLLDLKANLLSDGGLPADALDVIDQALERVPLLDEKLQHRLLATKAEILGKVGRTRRFGPGRNKGGPLLN